ncbi:MAG: prolyl aminopeptidase [Candidatus Pacebacteria bacterium]|nr:prolyl aminopeptidase [Candidatus Paceibacterota bacterium]
MKTEAYPEIEPHAHGFLPVDDLHSIYWEECGNPRGQPVLFLHGGPGAGCSPSHRRFFDPSFYRIILFDQRGCGRSKPFAEIRQNFTLDLIEDIEKLRLLLQVESWLIFGGSWGSTLALAYGQAYPERCIGFVLRGIFLGTAREVNWFVNGIANFYPEAWHQLIQHIPPDEQSDLLAAFGRRLFNPDPSIHLPAARAWSQFESGSSYLLPLPSNEQNSHSRGEEDGFALGLARLELHYFLHDPFLKSEPLLKGVERIVHLPAVIVQGRYDMVCPPLSAYYLALAWPLAEYNIIADAGHSAMEPGIRSALVRATNRFRDQLSG